MWWCERGPSHVYDFVVGLDICQMHGPDPQAKSASIWRSSFASLKWQRIPRQISDGIKGINEIKGSSGICHCQSLS